MNMSFITPHLWFNNQATVATNFYVSLFNDAQITSSIVLHNTPSGNCDVHTFTLMGQDFMSISAGPYFTFNPSTSFMVACSSIEEVDRLWHALIIGGTALMPIDTYPFSKRYGWLNDQFGVSWQLMHDGGRDIARITPSMLFTGDVYGKAEEAMNYYVSVFPNAKVHEISRYGETQPQENPNAINYARFTLNDTEMVVMDSGLEHNFAFNEAVSFIVECDTQEEIDTYWNALSAVPEAEQCGWLKDRFGVSWQIVPRSLHHMMRTGTQEQIDAITQAFLPMKKFDIAALEEAFAA